MIKLLYDFIIFKMVNIQNSHCLHKVQYSVDLSGVLMRQNKNLTSAKGTYIYIRIGVYSLILKWIIEFLPDKYERIPWNRCSLLL